MPIGAIRDNRPLQNSRQFSRNSDVHKPSGEATNPDASTPVSFSVSDVNHLTRSTDSGRKSANTNRADSPAVGTDLVEPDRQNNNGHMDKMSNGTPGLSRARKRARSETKGVTPRTTVPKAPLERNEEDDLDDENDDSMDDEPGQDFDYPLNNQADMDVSFRGRQRRPSYQQPPPRRDSSLGGYGSHSVYGSSGGTLPRRRRGDVSLTRALTISGVDPLGTMRNANRLAQSILNGSIPPPPSEPPPATPLSGSLMSELGSSGTPTGMFNSFALQMQQQQQQQRLNAALAAAVASGRVNPQFLNTSGGVVNPYLLNASNSDASQLFQMQQQQQQQAAALLQQHQHQQQLLAAGLIQPSGPNNYGFNGGGTLGRRGTSLNTAGQFQTYASAAALLAAQQQQQQQHPIYQAHSINPGGAIQLNDLAKMGLLTSPSTAMLQQEATEPLLLSQQGGSGSVVYENSFNSFRRLLSGNVTQSPSQDGLQNPNNNNNNNNAQNALSMNNSANIGRSQTLNDAVATAALMQNLSAPVPPPNHPSYDLLDARSIDPTYGTHATLRSSNTLQGKGNPNSGAENSVGQKTKRRCPWYYWIISILVLAFLLALVLAVSFSAEKQHLTDRLRERYSQDPGIIGLFNPSNPPVRLEPDKPINFVLDRMGVWSAEWHARTSRYYRYNITVASELTVIGLFMRQSTMPTILQYDILDRIQGQGLQPIKPNRWSQRRTKRADVKKSYQSTPTHNARQTGRVHYLEEGRWFLALVNDKPRPEPVTFSMGDAVMDDGCPNDCSNRGVCNRGNCDCMNGFKGPDCSVALTPEVCNGHGDYVHGSCQCYPEWKGSECQLLWSECADPLCSNHGQCVVGECQCYPGYSGESCEQHLCPSTNCSGNGICQPEGTCRCFSGWSGAACDWSVPVMNTAGLLKTSSKVYGPTSSSEQRNSRAPSSLRSVMDAGHTEACFLSCGPQGQCHLDESNRPKCHCSPGWSGHDCSIKLCTPACSSEHGQCVNGTCVCDPGWSGAQCGLNDCPDRCNGHGQCLKHPNGQFHCSCSEGWKGSACQTMTELICDDEQDNDQDGLIDCLDPDCCPSAHCRNLFASGDSNNAAVETARQSCAHSESFHYRLLVTQMAQPGSTFYGQLEFLLRRDEVALDNFDPRRISVVTGTVHQSDGTPFWGVRVSDSHKMQNGYTLTDEHGRFDLPVDGGSIVRLEFLRFPTRRFSAIHYIFVPVNQIVQLGNFYLHDAGTGARSDGGLVSPSPIMHDLWMMANKHSQMADAPVCTHQLSASQSLLVQLEFDGGKSGDPVCLDGSICVGGGGELHFAIPFKDTRLRLIYRSDRTAGHQAVVNLRLLTGLDQLPRDLREIHLILDVAGLRLTQRVEPQLDADVVFYWNKTDAYNRTVYGIVNAKVSAGFIYEGCSHIVWEHRVIQLRASELPSTELANWNLNVVHMYSINHGIVYRGDGAHQYLKHSNWHVSSVLGSGTRRREPNSCLSCTSQSSIVSPQPLLYVHSLVSDVAGHVLVADAAYLRWLKPIDSTQRTSPFDTSDSLEHRAQSTFRRHANPQTWFAVNISNLPFLSTKLDDLALRGQGHYQITAHPHFLINQSVLDQPMSPMGIQSGAFLAHPDGQTIWWLADSVYAQPLISAHCSTLQAMYPALTRIGCLSHPLQALSGIAVTSTRLYFADDKQIWSAPLLLKADTKQEITLVVGTDQGTTDPMCLNHSIPGHEMALRNPKHLVYSAFEDVLYFADGPQVYRLHLATQTVSHIAGLLNDCPGSSFKQSSLATASRLSDVTGLAISPEGELYIAEANRIQRLRADGRLYHVAGKLTHSEEKHIAGIADYDRMSDLGLAKEYTFGNITAITATIYGELFVADMGHGTVYRVHYRLPSPSERSSTYHVLSDIGDERFIFNSNGQLMQTENAITQTTLHQLDYRAHALFGWLSEICGNNVNLRFRLQRDTEGQLTHLQTPLGLFYNVSFHSPPHHDRISRLSDPWTGSAWEFQYSPNGLLSQVIRPLEPRPIQFGYNQMSGRLEQIVSPSGLQLNGDDLRQFSAEESFSHNSDDADPSIPQSALSLSYGDSLNNWTMDFNKIEHFLPSGLSRLDRLSRSIKIPGQREGDSLVNLVDWKFDWNDPSTRHDSRWFVKRHPRQLSFSSLASASSSLASRSFGSSAIDWEYRKRLTINGLDILHVNFDWARQLETYEHPSTGSVVLQVVYNANFQPMIFNASAGFEQATFDTTRTYGHQFAQNTQSPSPLSVTYTSNGQVSTIHWGSAHYRFNYDPLDRLKAADLGSSMDSVSFQYTDDRVPYQPTQISVNGLGPFKLIHTTDTSTHWTQNHQHDNRIGLSRVITPSGLTRDFSGSIGLGVRRLFYNPWPGSPGPWIYEWGTDVERQGSSQSSTDSLISFIWSSGRRRLTWLPKHNRLVYDQTDIEWKGMKPVANTLERAPYVQLSDVRSGYSLFQWRTYRGPLVDSLRIQHSIPGANKAHPSLGGLLHGWFRYTYDENLKLVDIHSQLYAQTDQFDQLIDPNPHHVILDEHTLTKRDPTTGQVLSIRDLDVEQRSSTLLITSTAKGLQLYRQLDSQGRLRRVVLSSVSSQRDPIYNLSFVYHPNSLYLFQQREEQHGHVPRWVNFVHGPGGRLEAIDREEAGSSLRSHTVLVHNTEGRVARLRIAVSDPQLVLPGQQPTSGSTSRSEELQFVYDTRGLLKRRGNWHYTFDEDGFLTERRLSDGQLVDLYAYNSKGLLIWAERTINTDDLKDTDAPFDHSPPIDDDVGLKQNYHVQFVYDEQDRLVVIRDTLSIRDFVQYFYADPGHPDRLTHIFHHGNLVTTRLHYDPISGHVIFIEEFDRLVPTNQNEWTGPLIDGGLSSNRRLYFVVTNHQGAPVALITEEGKTVWTAEYSITGIRRLNLPDRKTYYRNTPLDDVNLPLSHAGCLVDKHTGFLFCPGARRAPYDPLGATFLTPDWRRLLLSEQMLHLYRDPSIFDTHKWGLVEQHRLSIGPGGLMERLRAAIDSPEWWLKQTGLDLATILPIVDPCTGVFSWPGADHPTPSCTVDSWNKRVQKSGIVQPSQLTPGIAQGTGLPTILFGTTGDWARLVPTHAMFGPEVYISMDRSGNIKSSPIIGPLPVTSSRYTDDFPTVHVANILLDGTRLIDWWTDIEPTRSTPLLIQSLAKLGHVTVTLRALAGLGLKLPVYHADTALNITATISNDVQEIWLSSRSIQWRIRYLSSWDEAYLQAISNAQERARSLAWAQEIERVRHLDMLDESYHNLSPEFLAWSHSASQLLGLRHLWTYKEISQLKRKIPLTGTYRWVPVLSPPKTGNGTAQTRIYGDPGSYQLRPIDRKLRSPGS